MPAESQGERQVLRIALETYVEAIWHGIEEALVEFDMKGASPSVSCVFTGLLNPPIFDPTGECA